MEELPLDKLPWDMFMPDIIEGYFLAGGKEQALRLVTEMREYYSANLEYYTSLRPSLVAAAEYEIQTSLGYISRVSSICISNGEEELGNDLADYLQTIYSAYIGKTQRGM